METAYRESNLAVTRTRNAEDILFEEPYRFEFVQAMRLLHLFSIGRSAVGFFQQPGNEIVRFSVPASLSFPASEIQSLEPRESAVPLMRVNFLGAIGALGVLPIYYTELVASRLQDRDSTLADFLDLFHHRLISLFYRAWQKYRFEVSYEKMGEDQLTPYLFDLIGLGTKGLQRRQSVADRDLLHYTGLLAQQPRSACALEQILSDYFGVPAHVEQFLGAWYRLGEDSQCLLDDPETESRQMGLGAIVGDEIWDPQARVRIVLGPLSLDEYLEFLPSGRAFQPLRSLVRFFAGDELDFEVQLVLRREDVPSCELGSAGKAAPQLGWLSWGKTQTMDRDPSETILQL